MLGFIESICRTIPKNIEIHRKAEKDARNSKIDLENTDVQPPWTEVFKLILKSFLHWLDANTFKKWRSIDNFFSIN